MKTEPKGKPKKKPPQPPRKPCPQLAAIIEQNVEVIGLLKDLVNGLTSNKRE